MSSDKLAMQLDFRHICNSAQSLLFLAMKILVIHGPNLPFLGKISAGTGSRLTLDKVNTFLRRTAYKSGIELKIFQLYSEEKILKAVARNRFDIVGLIISPGALAFNCYTLHELLSILKIMTVEVHLSEMPDAKASFDQSALRDIAVARFLEPGLTAYQKGLQYFIETKAASQ
ncbi:MAG TPA: type II 3-dehydroquinate dehydratase [Candidatus Marinimicrobia bacterium]|nr:type II 3-dehydroquinate dehydratase [Candidatus Neomarinimicrobiota bacterium]HRU93407.1 type II 3-dehydroquinate dehydratase [Candidatus Neomarinimicrobiota bacterium]